MGVLSAALEVCVSIYKRSTNKEQGGSPVGEIIDSAYFVFLFIVKGEMWGIQNLLCYFLLLFLFNPAVYTVLSDHVFTYSLCV